MIAPKVAPPTKHQEHEAYELVQLRDKDACVRCGKVDTVFGMSMDHRKNRSQGGLTVASNLQLLCGSGSTQCHGWKSQNPSQAVLDGFAVPGFADPLTFPARRLLKAGSGAIVPWPVLYDDEGGFHSISVREFRERLVAAGVLPSTEEEVL